MYADRNEAGRRLADLLEPRLRGEDVVVLALPRGGVPVALEVAKRLHAPLDLLYVRKIGAPGQPELAIGAVTDGPRPHVLLNEGLIAEIGVPERYIEETKRRKLADIERYREIYHAGRPRVPVAGRTAVLIDDGIATGTTARAALRGLRDAGAARTVLAVPLAPADTLAELAIEADDVVCPLTPSPFWAIGIHYQDFHQVPDREVVAALDACRDAAPAGNADTSAGHDR